MGTEFQGQIADVFSTWDSIRWRRIVLNGEYDLSTVADAREALAEDMVGGGFSREFIGVNPPHNV